MPDGRGILWPARLGPRDPLAGQARTSGRSARPADG